MFWNKPSKEEYKIQLLKLWKEQLAQGETQYMTIVMTEAIRKLEETDLDPKAVENWVVLLEKTWRKSIK